MGLLMLIRTLHAAWFFPEALLENLIPLVFSLLLAGIVTMMHRPLTERAKELSLMNPTTVPWSATTVVMILGLGMFSFQLILLN
jgi:hypothetical protein